MDPIYSSNEYEKMHEASRAELIADISEDVLALVHALDIQREPDSEDNTYTFGAREGNYQIPESVRRVAGSDSELEDFTVNFTRDSESEIVSSQVCFIYRLPNDQPSTFVLTHYARPNEPQYYSMEQLVGRDAHPMPHPVEVPSSEISRLFASIAMPHKNGDFSIFNSADHNETRILKSFDEVLEKHSTRTLRVVNYWLEDNAGHLSRFQFDTENDQPIAITLFRNDDTTNDRFTTSIDFQPGPTNEFADEEMLLEADKIHMMISKGGTNKRHNPTIGDLVTLDDSIREFTKPFTVPVESLENMDQRGVIDIDPFDTD